MNDLSSYLKEVRQLVTSVLNKDTNGNPAGGRSSSIGMVINWISTPRGSAQPTGTILEAVIFAAIDRLEHFQDSKFACIENHKAIDLLYQVVALLDERRERRLKGGVEGTFGLMEVEGDAFRKSLGQDVPKDGVAGETTTPDTEKVPA